MHTRTAFRLLQKRSWKVRIDRLNIKFSLPFFTLGKVVFVNKQRDVRRANLIARNTHLFLYKPLSQIFKGG
jgi:hypothetical protein